MTVTMPVDKLHGPPPTNTLDALEYWRRRAIWAENALIVIERELIDVSRRQHGRNLLWRLCARYPRTMERLSQHRDREQQRRFVSRLRPRRS